LLLAWPQVREHAERHGLFQTPSLHAFAQLGEEPHPWFLAGRVLVGGKVCVLGLAGGRIEQRHHRALADRPLVVLCPRAGAVGAQVQVPDHEDDELRFAHLLLDQVQIAVHDLEVEVVAVALLDPADHGLGVPQVRLGHQRHIDHAAAHVAQVLESVGNHLEVLIGPERHVVVHRQRIGRLDQLDPGAEVRRSAEGEVSHGDLDRRLGHADAAGLDGQHTAIETGLGLARR